MSDVTKLPKWAQELLASKDREIRHLTSVNADLRRDPIIDEPVGFIQLQGYDSEKLPVGPYFRLNANDLEVVLGNEGLEVRTIEGGVCALPRVSNVMLMRRVKL